MNGPSPHISWKELACKDGTPYPQQFIDDGRIDKLAKIFEEIRAYWKKPITINSAYRTIPYNHKIGGAVSSQHITGRALDIQPPDGISMDEFYNTIRKNIVKLGIKGLGKYPTWVHIDIRLTDKIAYWSGKSNG